MDAPSIRRLWVTVGGGLLVAALAVALGLFLLLRGPHTATPPPASTGGLVVTQAAQQAKLDPQKPLRCFVNGQLVGEETLADCAKRNGVATEALDIGVDQTGQLAAANQNNEMATPLAPLPQTQVAAVSAQPDAVDVASGAGDCLRYAAATWREAGAGMSLSGCVKLLFDGHCAKGGATAYGRWMSQTLRQTTGEIDISNDDKDFHQLVPQTAPDCAIVDF
ncbi:MAG TPA: hypothetical protein VN805_03040 [Caulobacteraceae bacterium]|nr:hypothetical protein [Caulobacteraceae bacterium]